jgi:hypothetical protein
LIIEGMSEQQKKELEELLNHFKKDNPDLKSESFTQLDAAEVLKKKLEEISTNEQKFSPLKQPEKIPCLVIDEPGVVEEYVFENLDKEQPKPANNFCEIRIGDKINVRGLSFRINYINEGKKRISADFVK